MYWNKDFHLTEIVGNDYQRNLSDIEKLKFHNMLVILRYFSVRYKTKTLDTIVSIDTEKGGYWFLDGGILSFKYHKRVSRLIWDVTFIYWDGSIFCGTRLNEWRLISNGKIKKYCKYIYFYIELYVDSFKTWNKISSSN